MVASLLTCQSQPSRPLKIAVSLVGKSSARRVPLYINIFQAWSLQIYASTSENNMNEDERYRKSTQFRLWSYTPEALAAQRLATNQIAAERVKAAIQRARASRAASSASGETSEAEQNGATSRAVSADPGGEVNCLTVEEELKLVAFYCRQTLQLGDHLKVPTDVKVRHHHLPPLPVSLLIWHARRQQSSTSSASTSPIPS